MSGAHVATISPDSPAAAAGVAVGDVLVSVNGRAPTDVIEYQQLVDGERVELALERGGATRVALIEKPAGAPLGLTVDSAVFDRIRTCDNHCSFCFIYQLPKGLRRSLYVKDDDYRLSFLYGNYTTLTRFTELDLERVIDERLSPLYVSIHTTDPERRAAMLRNPRGATSLRWLDALLRAGVEVHGQVVVCPGVNDGAVLEATLQDALSAYPSLASLALVPLGVSDFSTEAELRPHTRDEAARVVELVARYHALSLELLGRPCVVASDEFYLVAGERPPGASHYASLDQAENGVGMVAHFTRGFVEREESAALGSGFFQSVDGAPAWGYRAPRAAPPARGERGPVAILTGEYAAPILRELVEGAGYANVVVVPVENRYFGGNIKVAGLLTGADLTRALAGVDDATTCLVPDACLNEGRFLDGLTPGDLPRAVTPVRTSGRDLRDALDALAPTP